MFTGSCHCGAVRFTVATANREILECNCSMCTKKGILHLIVEKSELTILSGEEFLQNYEFGSKTAKHYFCRQCGIHPFYVPRSHPNGYSVNFRCLAPYDELRSEFNIRAFDGQNWEKNIDSIA